ncbi:hypothetical protein ASPZODRAFT_65366 [Penicilliopsis zonata CBS 506.65]|uniref:AAA+ ATPase domain-containing protein n=1 Tax=Penicilliopsis zonata CBS 506.65 TaxID=1073090 RepID=A0A1L9SIG1_9EURO|nr:hypothetical protein ASPZODRAFT_65366 [Penicilliopsis zonata CBS 506.65]OJJ47020.1 hypothetical protein ASPZODRAFT_65366 [Penicilliopsis zonata CBS 506.65]
MPFMSSPAVAPAGALSPVDTAKRRLEEQSEQSAEPKRQKMLGGFLADDDDEEEDDDVAALYAEDIKSQYEGQDQIPEPWPTQSHNNPGNWLDSQQSNPLPDMAPASVPTVSSTADSFAAHEAPRVIQIKTCAGKTHITRVKAAKPPVSYERLIASRSTTAPGRAQKSYYGIEIHKLLDEAAKDTNGANSSEAAKGEPVQRSIEPAVETHRNRKLASAMWTEKYRARKFTDLIGDERTHRAVLRWLKGWDPIVFPNLAKSASKKRDQDGEERAHRKVLLLCGPPGLGKTTLAHVCARQAGYEVLEINASDERSRDVVKGRIRDALGTENVKGMNVEVGDKKVRKAGRPVCVVVDEVDGVVSGSGGSGEGGFMKALIDLVLLDQKNSARNAEQTTKTGKKRKGDTFRFLRPLILVCNDVYHPSLRPLRASSIAEMIHVRQAPLENVVQRVKNIFSREGIPCENDGVRRLCEAAWGIESRKQRTSKNSGSNEGDIRSVLVAAEWVAHKIRNEASSSSKLTKSWLEQKILCSSSDGSNALSKGLSRGGVREIVDRVFTEGAGFSDAPLGSDSFRDKFDASGSRMPVGVADMKKRHAINRLREMIDASGDHDRCLSECFASYPIQAFQDDTFLSKPNAAYEWLHFHDTMSSKVFSNQDWELTPYLSQSVLAFHHLFSSASGKINLQDKLDEKDNEEEEDHPFSGPRADFAAFEAQKQNRAVLNGFQSSLSAPMNRLFRSAESVATDLIPSLMRMLSPDVKPVVVRGSGEQKSIASVRKESERTLVQLAVRVMVGMGVTFEKVRVENESGGHSGWAYRMEPPLDSLVAFSKMANAGSSAPVRYAVRQVLDQEYRKETMRKQSEASILPGSKSGKRHSGGPLDGPDSKGISGIKIDSAVKRDFFGRLITESKPQAKTASESPKSNGNILSAKRDRKVWVTFHEGFSNAVRKPISMSEFLAGL